MEKNKKIYCSRINSSTSIVILFAYCLAKTHKIPTKFKGNNKTD